MLGANGVNIKAIASERSSQRPLIRIVTDDEATTKSTLMRAGIPFDLQDVLSIRMIDRPGELGKIARKLAMNAVNVNSIYIIGKEQGTTEMALTVDNLRKAESVLR